MTPTKFLRKLCIILIVLVLLSILGLLGIFYFTDINKHKEIISQKFHELTGQELIIQGPIKVKLFPLPHGEFTDAIITLPRTDPKLQVSLSSTDFTLSFASLFSDNKKIHSFNIKNAIVSTTEKGKQAPLFTFDHLSGRINTSCCHMEINNLHFKQGKNELKGNVNFSFANDIPEITGELTTHRWDLSTGQNPGSLFMFLDWVEHADTKIKLSADAVHTPNNQIKNAKIDLMSKEKKFTLLAKGTLPQGNLTGSWVATRNAKKEMEAKTQFEVKGEQGRFFNGDLALKILPTGTVVRGKLHTSQWTVPFFHHEGGKAFSDDPITLLGLREVTGQLDYRADKLIIQNYQFDNATVKVDLTRESIDLQPHAKLVGGDVSGNIKIDRKNKADFFLSGDVSIKNANATEFIRLFKSKAAIAGGSLHYTFRGHTHGTSEATFMANLTGNGLLHIENMTVLNEQMDSRFVDIFAALWKKLIPTKKNSSLECAAWRMVISDGVVHSSNGIALETPELYAVGSGFLNLKTEHLDFAFTLYPRSQWNIEVGSFDNVIYLKGTLDDPKITASSKGLIEEGGTLVLGYATGGVSLLAEKLYKVVTQKGSPCRQVLSQQ